MLDHCRDLLRTEPVNAKNSAVADLADRLEIATAERSFVDQDDAARGMRTRLDLSDEAGDRFVAPLHIVVNRWERPESLDAASREIRETWLRRFPLAGLDDPSRYSPARRFAVDTRFSCASETGLTEAERHRKVVLRRQTDAILVMMITMSESHEGWALELDNVRLVGIGQVLNERADISARVRVRRAKIVVVRVAKGVSRDRSGMQHAEPSVVEANCPAAHFQAARVAPLHELAKNVSALGDNVCDLGLDREPLPSRGRRMKIDCAVLRKIDLSLRTSRLEKAAGVIRGREADAVEARAVTQFAERRIVSEIEYVPGICPHRPMHFTRLQSAFVLLQSSRLAKLSASADVKRPSSDRVNAVHAPRIVIEKRGLLGF